MLIAALLFLAAPAHASKATDIIGKAVDGYIRPAHATFADSAKTLAATIETLCAAPSEANLKAARENFITSANTFARIETIRIGPITENNRLERLLFWPDRKGIGLKQVQAILAEKNPGDVKPEVLPGKSVAAQGFGALEFVLFGTGAETLAGKDDPFRCAYGNAVAGNIAAIGAALSEDWAKPDGFAATWMSPGPDNPHYRDGTEAVSELVSIFVDGLELIRDVRVKGFLGETAEDDKPKQALYWRSANTAGALKADMEGLKALFEASHLGNELPADQSYIAQSASFEFTNAINAARASFGPIDAVLGDKAKRGKLAYFAIVTSSLSEIFGTRLSAAFGLSAGFSSLDGD